MSDLRAGMDVMVYCNGEKAWILGSVGAVYEGRLIKVLFKVDGKLCQKILPCESAFLAKFTACRCATRWSSVGSCCCGRRRNRVPVDQGGRLLVKSALSQKPSHFEASWLG